MGFASQHIHIHTFIYVYTQVGTPIDLVVIDNSWASHSSSVIVTYHVDPPISAEGRKERLNDMRQLSGNTYIHTHTHTYTHAYIHIRLQRDARSG